MLVFGGVVDLCFGDKPFDGDLMLGATVCPWPKEGPSRNVMTYTVYIYAIEYAYILLYIYTLRSTTIAMKKSPSFPRLQICPLYIFGTKATDGT